MGRIDMNICIAADSAYVNGMISEFFGRCKFFIYMDTESDQYEIIPNAVAYHDKAGIRAADKIAKKHPQAILTRRIGKNALNMLKQASIAVYISDNITVGEAVQKFRAGELKVASAARNGRTVEEKIN